MTPPGPDGRPVIIEHLKYLRLRDLSPGTIDARCRALRRLSASACLPVPLLDADPAMLAAWRESLAVSPSTVVGYVSHVRQFYAWAVDEDLIVRNPAARIPVPRLGRRLPRPIGEAELFAVVELAPRRIRPWLVLAAWAGLRAQEIAWLRRECVLDTLRRPVLVIAADAAKGPSERIVPMSPFVLGELRPHLPAAGWVFPRHDGGPGPNAPHLVSHLANEFLHECGVTATLHQLRHRFGTQAYEARRDLRAVQELMGHATPQTTAGYAAYSQPSAIDAVNALPVPGGPGGHLREVGGALSPGRAQQLLAWPASGVDGAGPRGQREGHPRRHRGRPAVGDALTPRAGRHPPGSSPSDLFRRKT
jgi:integrase